MLSVEQRNKAVELPPPTLAELVRVLGLKSCIPVFFDKLYRQEVEPQLLPLNELARELGFIPDKTLEGIEYFIRQPERTAKEVEQLIHYYDDNAQLMFDRKDKEGKKKRTDRESLGLLMYLAYLRKERGILTHYLFNFEDTRDFVDYSPDLDKKTRKLAHATINALEEELTKNN